MKFARLLDCSLDGPHWMLHRGAVMLAMPPVQEFKVPKQEPQEKIAPMGAPSDYGLLEKALSYLYRYVRLAEEASKEGAAKVPGPGETPHSEHG